MRMTFRCDPALRSRPSATAGSWRNRLPDWLRAMPAKAHSDIHGREVRTVKECPPFVDAMTYGVMIPSCRGGLTSKRAQCALGPGPKPQHPGRQLLGYKSTVSTFGEAG